MNLGFINKAAVAATNLVTKATTTVAIHSPQILVGVGIVSGVAAIVTACRATTKVQEVVEEKDDEIDIVQTRLEEDEEYTEESARKDRFKIRGKMVLKFIRLYFPSIALEILSIICILMSLNIMVEREARSMAACTALATSFKEYRERVVDRFGEDVDYQLKNNIQTETIEEEVTDEKGKTKKVKKKVDVANPNPEDIQVRYFTRSNPNWDDNEENVRWFFTCQQQYLNDRLKTRRYVTLNEALEALHMTATGAGLSIGWVYDEIDPAGDNYIQFTVKPVKMRNEFGELEDCYSIEFNCDKEPINVRLR